MSDFTWAVRVRAESGQSATIHFRNHKVAVGSPVSFRPTDDLPSALETAIGCLGVDLVNGFVALARKRRIPLDAIEFSGRCSLANPLVHLAVVGEEGDVSIDRIDATLYVCADAGDETVQALFEETLRRAPLYQTLAKGCTVAVRLITTS